MAQPPLPSSHTGAHAAFDVIVVGAGVIGNAAALALSRRGVRVLLLEQFTLGHTQGSSHGGSRIIRYAHPTTDYAALMPAIFDLWRGLEEESGESLLSLRGGLYVATASDPFLVQATATLRSLAMPFEELTGDELRARYPQFALAAGEVGFVEPNAGLVAATRAVQAMAKLAQRHGATLRQGCRVRAVLPDGEGVRVEFDEAGGPTSATAARVLLAAGPWAPTLLRDLLGRPLPLRVTHQQVAYFRAENPAVWSPDRCPIYIFTADPHVYGFPIYERPGLIKIAQELFDTVVDPDEARAPRADATQALIETVRHRFIDIDPNPVQVDGCLYTETPTRDFIIDRHPELPQIVFAAGFSGRGFKFGIGIGELLAHLALTPPHDYAHPFWLPRFALARFLEMAPNAATADIFRAG